MGLKRHSKINGHLSGEVLKVTRNASGQNVPNCSTAYFTPTVIALARCWTGICNPRHVVSTWRAITEGIALRFTLKHVPGLSYITSSPIACVPLLTRIYLSLHPPTSSTVFAITTPGSRTCSLPHHASMPMSAKNLVESVICCSKYAAPVIDYPRLFAK